MGEFFKKNWPEIISTIISVIALIISGINFYNQLQSANHYRETTNQVLENSTKLALYDIDLLIYKTNVVNPKEVDPSQFEYQIDSLKENLNIIKGIEITRLPRNQSMNYQVYREDLINVIYKLESGVEGMKKVSKNKNLLNFNKANKLTFQGDLYDVRGVISTDKLAIEKDKNLYDQLYEHNMHFLKKYAKKYYKVFKEKEEGIYGME